MQNNVAVSGVMLVVFILGVIGTQKAANHNGMIAMIVGAVVSLMCLVTNVLKNRK